MRYLGSRPEPAQAAQAQAVGKELKVKDKKAKKKKEKSTKKKLGDALVRIADEGQDLLFLPLLQSVDG